MEGRRDSNLIYVNEGYWSFVRYRWIPFSDINTTLAFGVGILEGSGAS